MIALKDKVRVLPKKPGVYIYHNNQGQIIYIGKALSLRDRVGSYFNKNTADPKTIVLVSNIVDIKHIVVTSEFEALVLEAQLIKQHQPKFNIQQKDSKSHLYLLFTKQYPHRIFLGRRPELQQDLLDWYGPFSSQREARQLLNTIRHIFPFCTNKTPRKTPCLYYHLGLCPGVCAFPVPGYAETIRKIRQILSGKTKFLLKDLEKEMKLAAKEQRYEEAQTLVNQITSLKRITEGWRNVPKEDQDINVALINLRKLLVKYEGVDPLSFNKIEGYDVSNLGKAIIVGSMVVFIDGQSDNSLYRKFNLKSEYSKMPLEKQNDPEGIRQIVLRRLNHSEWIYPQLILVDGGKTQIGAAFEAIKEKNLQNQIAILGLTKEEETIVIPHIRDRKIQSWKMLRLPRSSPELKLLQHIRDESHRFAQNYYKLSNKKRFLND